MADCNGTSMCYKIIRRYKYETTRPYTIRTAVRPTDAATDYYASVDPTGCLRIMERYQWDGPSGPTIDTENSMRAGLVHDALYQLMRSGALESSRKNRVAADKTFRSLLKKDGMGIVRRNLWYAVVRLTSSYFTRAGSRPEQETICLD